MQEYSVKVTLPDGQVMAVTASESDTLEAVADRFKDYYEDMILEDGKYYPMFRCVPCADNSAWDNMDETTVTVCDLYGPVLIKNGNPVLRKFLVREHHKLAAIMQQLRTQEMSDSIMDRIEQINEMMAYNEAAYSTMGAIRNAGI